MTVRRLVIMLAATALVGPGTLTAEAGPRAPARAAPADRAQQDDREATETVTRRFTVGPNGSLDLVNLAGDVVVTGGEEAEIQLEAVKYVKTARGGARKLLESVVIDASESSGRVEVRTLVRQPRGVHASVDYTIRVPAGTAVALKSLAGEVRVTKVGGDVQIETANGDIIAIGVPRLVRVKSLAGDIHLEDAASPGALAATTVSGDVKASRVKARSVEVDSVSGNIVLENTACERANVRTISGDVHFRGALTPGGRYEFVSHSGDVVVGVQGRTGFELTARTFSGEVRPELPLRLVSDGGRPGRQSVKGTFGNGSALLLIKTFSGEVVVAESKP